ncbi:molybdate ABC transporter substrate-binding protein [Reinekea marinisedimentorum]|uniref:Molybdate transport system substrate-binding protein n=1 Tax=Reinekea marinisedimentorum TaxID=230495 RepID=A0A4R3I3H4_9GAMM|nr:molybdate ABC transporter substrate-binding protein [Reinekea marinisedimentorum]TCS40374.1 molybdate transport system substrate-binding protein [Reinekea marinisedimentorum]
MFKIISCYWFQVSARYVICFCSGFIFFTGNCFAEQVLFVHAGAGLRPALDIIAADFEAETSIKVLIDYAGSGQSLARIGTSQKGDVFIPGSEVYLDKLKQTMAVKSVYRVALHTPVIGVNVNRADQIHEFSDLTKSGVRIGLGDPASMALGRTAVSILEASGMGEGVKENTVVYAATIKQLALYLTRGDIDAAIIGRSDAIQNKDSVVLLDINPAWYNPEVIAVGVLGCAKEPELALLFARYVASGRGVQAFADVGFLPYTDIQATAEH